MKIYDYTEKNRWTWWYRFYVSLFHFFAGGHKKLWVKGTGGVMEKKCVCSMNFSY